MSTPVLRRLPSPIQSRDPTLIMRKLFFQVLDVLVRWDKDEQENVVSRSQLKVIGGGRLVIGSRVKMWWGDGEKWTW